MHHLLAFGSTSLDSSAGNVQLPAIADQIYSRSNSNFQIPTPHWAYWAYAGGTNVTRARIKTGSLQSKGFPQIYPMGSAVVPASSYQLLDMRDYPIALRQEEDLRMDTTSAAVAVEQVGFIAVSPHMLNYNINVRDLRVLRFTASSTLVADGWAAPAAITFEDVLEGGTYSVFGLLATGTNLVAQRLVFPNQQLRPGSLAAAAVTNNVQTRVFMGGMGLWGQFNTYAQPQLECYGTTAGAQTIEGRLLCGKA